MPGDGFAAEASRAAALISNDQCNIYVSHDAIIAL